MPWYVPRVYNQVDLAYAAGIIDGEGTVCCFPYRAEDRLRFRCSVGVHHTKLELLEWLKQTFGGFVAPVKRTPGEQLKCKPTWTWQMGHVSAARFLSVIMPYLLLKRRQAELVIEFQSTTKHWGYPGVPDEVSVRRQEIYDEMRVLNKKGVEDALVA